MSQRVFQGQDAGLRGFCGVVSLISCLPLFLKFELQAMVIHCDVTRARSEACYGLPAGTLVRAKATICGMTEEIGIFSFLMVFFFGFVKHFG